jgi:hypothetical protein
MRVDPEARQEYQRQWSLKNPDKRRAIEKRYREKNREKLRAASKRYCDRHREKRRASANGWYHANAAYIADKKRAQHAADPVKRRAQQLKHKYGMTVEQYNIALRAQGNICAACSCRFAVKGLSRPCVDHDHRKGTRKRGPVRGIICNRCNLVLGLIKDDTRVLNRLDDYLRERVS